MQFRQPLINIVNELYHEQIEYDYVFKNIPKSSIVYQNINKPKRRKTLDVVRLESSEMPPKRLKTQN